MSQKLRVSKYNRTLKYYTSLQYKIQQNPKILHFLTIQNKQNPKYTSPKHEIRQDPKIIHFLKYKIQHPTIIHFPTIQNKQPPPVTYFSTIQHISKFCTFSHCQPSGSGQNSNTTLLVNRCNRWLPCRPLVEGEDCLSARSL